MPTVEKILELADGCTIRYGREVILCDRDGIEIDHWDEAKIRRRPMAMITEIFDAIVDSEGSRYFECLNGGLMP